MASRANNPRLFGVAGSAQPQNFGRGAAAFPSGGGGGIGGQSGLQVAALQQQLNQINRQAGFQNQLFGQFDQILAEELEASRAARARAAQLEPIQDRLMQLQLEALERGGEATPEQIADINAATEAQLELGTSDINTFLDEALGRINQELAPSRGLRPTDTPIGVERSRGLLESQRQQGQLERQLRTAAANARLNLPLAQQQIFGAQNLNQQSLTEAAKQFQQNLSNQATVNRLRAAETIGGLGINLASLNLGTISPTQSTQTVRQERGLGIGDIIGGIGGLLSGTRGTGLFGFL